MVTAKGEKQTAGRPWAQFTAELPGTRKRQRNGARDGRLSFDSDLRLTVRGF